jgi:hypothetical protein
MVVATQQRAELEVERLNALDRSKESIYFWQLTRLEEGICSFESHSG